MTELAVTEGRHLVLVGPTASGKSDLAVELVRRRRASGIVTEIISADSMAVYRGMDIGTTTPDPAIRAEMPHHLIDVIDPTEEFSLAQFLDAARAALADIEERGASALIVGGTGLYVQALVDGLDVPGRYPQVRAELEAQPDTLALHRRLVELDPIAAARMEPTNRRRVLRALEVTLGSARPFSSYGPGLERFPATPFVMVGLHVDRAELGARIRARLASQLADGFADEVARLVSGPALSRTAAQALGYQEIAQVLSGEVTLDDAVELIVERTRRFAIRQERWFRRDPRIRWFPARPHPVGPHDPGGHPACAEILRHWHHTSQGSGHPESRSGRDRGSH